MEFPEGYGHLRRNPFRGGGIEFFWNYTKFYSCESQFREKMRYFPVSNFCLLYYPGMRKRNSSKSGCSCLQEVPNIAISLQNIWYFAKLVPEEKWSQLKVWLYKIHNKMLLCKWCLLIFETIGSFRLDYEYEIEYEYDCRISNQWSFQSPCSSCWF